MYEDAEYFFEMLASGASGYVPSVLLANDLMSAIRVVRQGDVHIYPSMAKLLVKTFYTAPSHHRPGRRHPNTTRARGAHLYRLTAPPTAEIADTLVISVKTVDRHRENIMHKLNLHNRVEAREVCY